MGFRSQNKRINRVPRFTRRSKKTRSPQTGKELDLFTFSQKIGQGLPLWLPKGTALRERLENFLKEAQKAGYEQVISPHIGNKKLYMTSGIMKSMVQMVFNPYKRRLMGRIFAKTNELSAPLWDLQCPPMEL